MDSGGLKTVSEYSAEKRIEQIAHIENELSGRKETIIQANPIAKKEISEINAQLVELENERNKLTGYAVISSERGIFTKIFNWLFDAEPTGYTVKDKKDKKEKDKSKDIEIIIEEPVSDVEIEYYTEAPVAEETMLSPNVKQIIVSSDVHYENITAYTSISPEVPAASIKLYRIVNEKRELVSGVNKFDNNNNSFTDYIEWIVPSLSNQTYELVIEIAKAEHLDASRSFVSDVYNYVRAWDGNYSLIPEGHYMRVTFEQNLTSERDITIYARSNASASVEVYAKDSEVLVAEFENISSESWHKIYLTLLNGSHDVFDLRSAGDVEYDYIVDPMYQSNITIVSPLNNSNLNSSSVVFNVSINANWCGMSLDLGANITMHNSVAYWNFSNSSIPDGAHNVMFFCNDTAGNMNFTSSYFTVDTIIPNISFVTPPTPANGSYLNDDYLFANVSASDSNNISTFIDFDNSLVSWWRMDDTNGSVGECYDNETQILTESGWKYFYDLNDEKVATLNPTTQELEWETPSYKAEWDHNGEMYNIETKKGALIVSPKHKLYAKSSPVSVVMMPQSDKSDDISFNSKFKDKAVQDMDSSLSTEVMHQRLVMLWISNNLSDLIIKSLAKDRILLAGFDNLSFAVRMINKRIGHSLNNSSTEFSFTNGPFFLDSISFLNSSFSGNSSTGCQSISSQNFSSSLEMLPVLIYESNMSFFINSSLADSDQFTQEYFFSSFLNSSDTFIVNDTMVHLSSNNLPEFFNSSNRLISFNLTSSLCFRYSGQLICGCLSNLSFNSLGMDTVNVAIVAPPLDLVSKRDLVYNSFGLMSVTEAYDLVNSGKILAFKDEEGNEIKVLNITKQQYSGKIYDVDVKNDIVLVRRKNAQQGILGLKDGKDNRSRFWEENLGRNNGKDSDGEGSGLETDNLLLDNENIVQGRSRGWEEDSDGYLVVWSGNSNVKVYDYTGRNNGTAYGNATQTDAGKLGKGFRFDGSGDYIDFPDAQQTICDGCNFSISVWFKTLHAADQGVYGNTYMVTGNGRGYEVYLGTNDFVYMGIGNGSLSKATAITTYNTNVWNNLVFSFNGTYMNGYYNGAFQLSEDVTDDLAGIYPKSNAAASETIGGAYEGIADFFNGSIDDVMIFNRSLSADEIAGLYANQSSKYLTNNFTSLADGTHTIKAYTQDIAGNVNSTELRQVSIDTTQPGFTDNKTNATATTPRYNEVLQLNITVTDAVDVNTVMLATNISGTLANSTNLTFAGSADTSVIAIFNLTINMTKGLMQWQVWANDSVGNANVSELFTVVIQNTAPITPNMTAPANNSNLNESSVLFNFSSSDIDDDSITYYLFINSVYNDSTADKNFTKVFADGSYNWSVIAGDLTDNSSMGGPYYLTVDTIYPNISFISPTPDNNARNRLTEPEVTINASVSDNYHNYSSLIDWNYTLSGWWRAEGSMLDSSSRGNNAGCSYCPTITTSGARGKAFDFDGTDDYLEVNVT